MSFHEEIFWKDVLVINLLERKDRFDKFNAEFSEFYQQLHHIQAVESDDSSKVARRRACLNSHARALEHAQSLDLPFFLLMEDDAVWNPKHAKSVSRYLENLPEDFDMLYLGAWMVNWNEYADNLRKSDWTMLTHSIFINSRCLNRLINHLKENQQGERPVDYLYADLHRELKVYVCVPSIHIQSSTFSDIEQKILDFSALVDWESSTGI